MSFQKSKFIEKVETFIDSHEKISICFMVIVASIILSDTFFTTYPLHTTTDELGAIVGAATLAGYDWSGIIGKSGYYGFGYYSLFAPLFKMQLSPIIIYRIILIVTRIFRGGVISSVVYYIGKHYFKFPSKFVLMQLALICTIPLHPNDDANIINDVVLDAMLWILILCVCKIAEYMEHTRKCIIFCFIYAALSAYAALLHTRALVMIIASFIVLIGLFIYAKKRVLFVAVSVTVISVILAARKLIETYQNQIWNLSGDGLRNASVKVTSNLHFFDSKTWKIWFDMLLGNISVQSLLTGGVFLIAIVAAIRYFYLFFIKKQYGEPVYVNIIFIISILSMGAAFAAFLVSDWFSNMYVTWNTVDMGKEYHYKALCYVRYWNVFAMPFLFTGVYLTYKKQYQNSVKIALFMAIILIVGFVSMVVPIIQTHSSAASFLFTFLTDRNEKVTTQFYYKCIVYCLLFVAVSIMIYYKKAYREFALLPILLFMVIGYHNANINYNEYVRERVSSMVLTSYEQKCLLEQSNVDIRQIYAYDDRKVDTNWYIFSVLQFYFYEYRIEDEYPDSLTSNDIIITYGRSEQIETDFPEVNCYILDDNEVWYTNIDLVGYEAIER